MCLSSSIPKRIQKFEKSIATTSQETTFAGTPEDCASLILQAPSASPEVSEIFLSSPEQPQFPDSHAIAESKAVDPTILLGDAPLTSGSFANNSAAAADNQDFASSQQSSSDTDDELQLAIATSLSEALIGHPISGQSRKANENTPWSVQLEITSTDLPNSTDDPTLQ